MEEQTQPQEEGGGVPEDQSQASQDEGSSKKSSLKLILPIIGVIIVIGLIIWFR